MLDPEPFVKRHYGSSFVDSSFVAFFNRVFAAKFQEELHVDAFQVLRGLLTSVSWGMQQSGGQGVALGVGGYSCLQVRAWPAAGACGPVGGGGCRGGGNPCQPVCVCVCHTSGGRRSFEMSGSQPSLASRFRDRHQRLWQSTSIMRSSVSASSCRKSSFGTE